MSLRMLGFPLGPLSRLIPMVAAFSSRMRARFQRFHHGSWSAVGASLFQVSRGPAGLHKPPSESGLAPEPANAVLTARKSAFSRGRWRFAETPTKNLSLVSLVPFQSVSVSSRARMRHSFPSNSTFGNLVHVTGAAGLRLHV